MEKISVYVTPETHRRLKAAAAERGLSLSDFMVQAAERALRVVDRREAAARMDALRQRIASRFTVGELREYRDEGRR